MPDRMKLEQVRRIALSLPSVTEEPHFDYTSFRVGGKIFATAPPTGGHLHVFVEEEQRQLALALAPEALDTLSWGQRVVGLRVALSMAKPALVKTLLNQSWSRKAPKRLLASTQPAAGYSATPLASKLGINEGCEVVLVGAPDGLRELLGSLPPRVTFARSPSPTTSIVHIFTTRRAELADALATYREGLSPEAVIWVSWPKKSSKLPSEVHEDTVRELALPLGFVDVKVCAVTEIWSGLKLVVRKKLR